MNTATQEAQWNFPDSAFNAGPSTSRRASAATAFNNNLLLGYIQQKNTIVTAITPIINDAKTMINTIYTPGASVTMQSISDLIQKITLLLQQQVELNKVGANIIQINKSYVDPALQTPLSEPGLVSLGYTKVFDKLRNSYIILDTKGNPVANPVSPATRSYTGMKGGSLWQATSRKHRKA